MGYSKPLSGSVSVNNLSLYGNPYIPEPVFPLHSTTPIIHPIENQDNWTVGDNIKFNDQWSALVGGTDARFEEDSGPSKTQDSYDTTKITPTYSLIYKPIPWVSTYASYIESLEPGTFVGPTFSNAGTMLPAEVDKQYEVGAKANVTDRILLTTA